MNITKTTSTTFCANLQQTNSDTNRLTVRTWLHLMQLTWHQTKSWSILLMRERERKKIKWAREDNRKSQLKWNEFSWVEKREELGIKRRAKRFGNRCEIEGLRMSLFFSGGRNKECCMLAALKTETANFLFDASNACLPSVFILIHYVLRVSIWGSKVDSFSQETYILGVV